MRTGNQRFRPSPHLKWNKVEGLAVVVDDAEGKVFRLNAVASAIWERLDGRRTLEEISAAIAKIFEVPERKIRKDCGNFIADLRRQELITDEEDGTL